MDDESETSRKRRRRQRGPTVADVARSAGVSAMTVSRVINREARVTAELRDRVNAAISTLGYVPNQAARVLAGGNQARIALLHSNPSAAYLSEFLVGALAEASACDAQLVIEHCAERADFTDIAERFVRRGLNACLLPPPLCENADLCDAMEKAGLPFAQIATGSPDPRAFAVSVDDEGAAHLMTTRLLGMGHRRIGLIAGNPNQTASALRRRGYERALSESGLTFSHELVEQGDFTYRSGLGAAARLLDRKNRPTAIFASNDDMAAAAVAVAHRMGLEIPAHLSVCGFDDTASATTLWPELTTIRQPISLMAQRGLRMLVDAISRAGHRPCHEWLEFELIGRESDGPAPQ